MKSADDSTSSEAATAHEGAGTAGGVSKRPSQRPGGSQSLVGVTVSGRYRIERVLGEGGMGAVYQAEHAHMRKRLAVKVLHPEMSRLPEVVARFEREAMAAAHIDHPNVAAATDFGKLDDGSFFLVLEYVEGKSLREILGAEGRFELGRALHVTFQITSALQRAHALGIVHRDLKPENIMLVERDGDPDFVKVLDFGIAKVPVGALAKSGESHSEMPILTQLGMVYGTPEYMSPEQALGQVVDARADLYALGIMLYEMLALVRPFDHESKVSLLGMHVTAKVPSFADKAPEAEVPAEVEALILKLLAKEASDRFDSAKDLLDAITRVTGLLIERQRIEPRFASRTLVGGSSPSLSSDGGVPSGRGSLAGPRSLTSTGGRKAQAETELASLRGVQFAGAWLHRHRPVVLGALGGALAVFGLVAVLAVHPKTQGAATTRAEGDAAPIAAAEEPSPDDKQIREALTDIDHGDYGSAIGTLAQLEPQHMDRADVHRGLERAYLGTRNVKQAIAEAGMLVTADPSSVHDPKLLEDVRNAALGKEAADDAFALLENGLAGVGVDVLYDIAHATWASDYPGPAARAQKILAKPEVRAKASPALAITLDLRSANTCEAKKATLPRAREVGDARTSAVLRSLNPGRGCGFLGTRDCWACMHRDGSLAQTIRAIDERPR